MKPVPANSVAILVPFRDRGGDPLRAANLERAVHHWTLFPAPVIIVDDGRTGTAPFCRSAAYNRGAAQTDADILVYTESDMLIHYDQIDKAAALAAESLGLVVPFTERRELSAEDSHLVRALKKSPPKCVPHNCTATNYGCINVVSRASLQAIGQWDEKFSGWGHDDCAMWIAFNIAAGPTRFVEGPAYHLHHQPPGDGPPADKAAIMANARRMEIYCNAKTPEQIRHLTAGGRGLSRNWRGQLQ